VNAALRQPQAEPAHDAVVPGATGRSRAILLANALEGLDAVHLAARLKRGGGAGSLLHVARDGPRLALLERLVRFFAPEVEIVAIPAWDCLPYDRVSPSAAVMAERLRALARLAAGPGRGPRLVLTTANALVQKVPPPELVRAAHFRAAAGQRVDRDALIAYLERNGYHRTSAVVEAGDYAVRGGLLDIFPSGAEQPLRLDFFGSALESVRSFDPLTQRSLGKVQALELMPVSEVLLDGPAIERFKAGYLRRFGAVTGDPLLEAVEAGRAFPGMEHWLPLFHPDLVPLTAYLDD
jgi:transcription-repair coupling factor (superfamily II helicase)